MLRWGITIFVSAVSLALTFMIGSVIRGGWLVSLPGLIYFLMFLNFPLLRWGERRWRTQEGLPPA